MGAPRSDEDALLMEQAAREIAALEETPGQPPPECACDSTIIRHPAVGSCWRYECPTCGATASIGNGMYDAPDSLIRAMLRLPR